MFRNNYDTDVTTWSPEGRLYQVEYAKMSVTQGSCCLGILGDEYVVVAAYKRTPNKMGSSQKKIFKIDDHLGIAISGLTADARVLASYMRTECLNYKYFYNTPMVSGRLVSDIADKSQSKTQASWKRPYGVGLLVAAYDKDGPHLYQTCPSGNLYELKAMAIGDRSNSAKTYLVTNLDKFPGGGKDELIKHALKALKSATGSRSDDDKDAEPELSAENACVAVVGKDQEFIILENDDILPYLRQI